MEGLFIPFIFFTVVLLLCAYLMYRVQTLKIDLKYLEKKLEIEIKYRDTLLHGLQGEVIDHKAKKYTLYRQFLKLLESYEDRFGDNVDFKILMDLLEKEI